MGIINTNVYTQYKVLFCATYGMLRLFLHYSAKFRDLFVTFFRKRRT